MSAYRAPGGACVVSFSGGRTSGYMLAQILGANPAGSVLAVFTNTGLEEEETLAFVHEADQRFNAGVVWLEYRAGGDFAVVDFASASRDGRPFTELIDERRRLPNPVQRFCTAELKVRTIRRYLDAAGLLDRFEVTALGIRADEPRRAARIRERFESGRDGGALEPWMPLVAAGVGVAAVHEWWARQSFGLQLVSDGRRTFAGNCSLCFCKPAAQRLSLIAERPERAVWWIEAERRIGSLARGTRGAYFTKDTPPYATLADFASRQASLVGHDEPQALDCFCGEAA